MSLADLAAKILNSASLSASKAALILNSDVLKADDIALVFDNANLSVSKAVSILSHANISTSKVALIFDNANLSVAKLADIFGNPGFTDAKITSIFDSMTRAIADLASVFNDADVPASRAAHVTENTTKSVADLASIFNHANLTASKAASIFDHTNLTASKAKSIYLHANLSDVKAYGIFDAMIEGVRKVFFVGDFENRFGSWTYVVINAAAGNAWEQVTDYVYAGSYAARLYGHSHNATGRDHRSKAYVSGVNLANKKIRVRSYQVTLASTEYGADYGLYAKFGDYAIYWSIAYTRAPKTPDLATNVARRAATVSGDTWKTAETDIAIADAFSAAGYPVPTDADEIEIGVACRATDGASACNTGTVDVRFDDFEVV